MKILKVIFDSFCYATVKGSSGQSTVIKLPLSSGEFFVKLYIKLYAEVPQDNKIDPHQPSVGYVTHVIYITMIYIYIRNTNSVTTSRFASTHIFWFRVSAMPHKGLKRRNAKKDQVTKYIQMGRFIIDGHFYLRKRSFLEFTIHWLGKYSPFKNFSFPSLRVFKTFISHLSQFISKTIHFFLLRARVPSELLYATNKLFRLW